MKKHSERKFYKIVKPLSKKYSKENRHPSRKWVNRSGNDKEPVIIGPGNDKEPVIIGPGYPPEYDPRPWPRYPGEPPIGSNPPRNTPGSAPGKTPREREPPVVVGPSQPGSKRKGVNYGPESEPWKRKVEVLVNWLDSLIPGAHDAGQSMHEGFVKRDPFLWFKGAAEAAALPAEVAAALVGGFYGAAPVVRRALPYIQRVNNYIMGSRRLMIENPLGHEMVVFRPR